jgi:hypothetical protein
MNFDIIYYIIGMIIGLGVINVNLDYIEEYSEDVISFTKIVIAIIKTFGLILLIYPILKLIKF